MANKTTNMTEFDIAMMTTTIDAAGRARPVVAFTNTVNNSEFDGKDGIKVTINGENINVTATNVYDHPLTDDKKRVAVKEAKDRCNKVVTKIQSMFIGRTYEEVVNILSNHMSN